MSEPGQTGLLQRAADGDGDAARRLIDETGPVIYGYVFVRVGGNQAVAEDIVQDTFLEAIRSAESFRGESALSTWMCTIARRRLARHYEQERRHEQARSRLSVVSPAVTGPIEVDEQDLVARALGALSAVHRQVLVLKYLDDLTVAAIAEQLGRTRVQVQSLLQRARAALKEQLEVAT